VPEPTPAPVAVAKPQPKPETRPEPKTVGKAEPVKATATAPDDGAKARALLEGKPAVESGPAAAEGRFVVQVGAFADPAKARETRLRVEKAGLKTYTHVAETKDGKRIRVRVGPFANRSEADKAAEKIKGLDLPAAILTL
jgi:DedD protein